MTAVSIGKGSESPQAGAWIAIGHGIVEFPLMIALYYGLGRFLDLPYVKPSIALVGGLFLFVMAIDMLRSLRRAELGTRHDSRSPLVAGVLLSAGNPYFLIWWATVGIALVMRSVGFGLAGFAMFAAAHWLCDFLWYSFLSAASSRGGRLFGRTFQKAIFGLCGAFLLFFGAKFILDAAKMLWA